jgi:hypothetical protein
MLSAPWALTTNTDERIKTSARINAGMGFIKIIYQ